MPVRVLIQQVDEATLQTGPDQWVSIKRGLMVFVCFLQNTKPEEIPRAIEAILRAPLHYHLERQENACILETRGDILIIPHASLGGKLKNGVPQYHSLCKKDEGQPMYDLFVQTMKEMTAKGAEGKQAITVCSGTYGNRQVMKMSSSGPFSHCLDL